MTQNSVFKSFFLSFFKQMSHSDSRLVWFDLVNPDGGKITNTSSVSLSEKSIIDQFKDAVKAKFSNRLSNIDAGDLLVFKDKDSFSKRGSNEEAYECLEEDAVVTGFGSSKQKALVVVVPMTQSGKLNHCYCF